MTSIRDTRPVVPGGGPAARGGWVKPLQDVVGQLRADVEGFKARLTNGLKGGAPRAYSAKRVFLPDYDYKVTAEQFNIPNNLPLNYVVRDGATYDVPIQFPGPGVFMARMMRVNVSQRIWVPAYNSAIQITMSSMDMPMLGSQVGPPSAAGPSQGYTYGVRVDSTYKISLFPTLPAMPSTDSAYCIKPAINFFWNLQDSKSGRWIADDLMSHAALMPRTYQPVFLENSGPFTGAPDYGACPRQPLDGGFYWFDTPLLIERDGQMNFRFRPVTPVLQYDSSVDISALVNPNLPPNGEFFFNDLEMGVRNQAVTVQVEIHGTAFENTQDLMHAGALSR